MKIKSIHISNFKSIGEKGITIDKPNPFSVFVGPNASGKSNIFEALEFANLLSKNSHSQIISLFYGKENILHRNFTNMSTAFEIDFGEFKSDFSFTHLENASFGHGSSNFSHPTGSEILSLPGSQFKYWIEKSYIQFYKYFCRIFVNNISIEKIPFKDDSKLSLACGNLEKVLKRILLDENKREEIIEWLQLLVPGFENIEIQSSDLSGTDSLLIYEKGIQKPFTKNLISDGTYNILSILTAVYQSDQPQFLCIEEPENGLNPQVIKSLINLFRDKTEDGHYIWLNTHSQTLVSQLKEEEIILVDKKDGETQIKQIEKGKSYRMPMDEAWLTNVLGGGLPW